MVRILGIDHGDRRVGVALSDPSGRLARPLRIVPTQSALVEIADLARAESVEKIVLGLPLNEDGSEGSQAHRVRSFAGRLARVTGCPVVFWDERLSSQEAEQIRRATRPRARTGREPLDHVAAAVILQEFLDAQSRSVLLFEAGQGPESASEPESI